MRNRTGTTPSPYRTANGSNGFKDKKMGPGGNNNMKTILIAVGLGVVGLILFLGGGSKGSTPAAATSNPNAVRRVEQVATDTGGGGDAAAAAKTAELEAKIKAQQELLNKQNEQLIEHAAAKEEVAQKAQIKQQIKEEAVKAAQEHHDQDQLNIEEAHQKAMEQKGIPAAAIKPLAAGGVKGVKQQAANKPPPGKKLVVKDADGDIVMDDMLAKDIAAGRDVDAHEEQEEEETDIAVGENRWHQSKNIPKWLKEYFDWHKKTTTSLVKANWRDQHYFVMTCLGGEICGNVAHRLRPIMGMLRLAADSKRLFYIHWDLPDRLEKFIHPPQHGGIDWIVPEFVMWKVRKSPHQNDLKVIEQQSFQDERRVVNVMYNDDSFAEHIWNSRRKEGEVAASQAFHDVWNVLFKPSFMLTERISESLRLMGLDAGEYATAHIDYEMVPKDDAEQEELRLKVENAMNCMSQLRPGGPFLVAAQTYAIAREAIVYGKQHNVKVHAKQIAHDTSTVPTDLFTSFVEIMLMANSRCVAYNRGGYGQLGYLLGYDYNCRVKYSGKDGEECKWKDPPGATEEQPKESHEDLDTK